MFSESEWAQLCSAEALPGPHGFCFYCGVWFSVYMCMPVCHVMCVGMCGVKGQLLTFGSSALWVLGIEFGA